MSGGLYSTEGRDFDQTLDLKKIKPYGDTMNDGKTQLSFTLPVPAGDEAIEAAKQLMKKMGFENPQVVFHQELTKGYTFFNCYGNCVHTVDYSNICRKWNRPSGIWERPISLSGNISVGKLW